MKKFGINKTVAIIAAALVLIVSSALSALGFAAPKTASAATNGGPFGIDGMQSSSNISVTEYYKYARVFVAKVSEDGDLLSVFDKVYSDTGVDKTNALVATEVKAQLATIVKCAEYRAYLMYCEEYHDSDRELGNDYSDTYYSGDALKSVKQIKKEALSKLTVEQSQLKNSESRENLEKGFANTYARAINLLSKEKKAFYAVTDEVGENLSEDYKKLVAVTLGKIEEDEQKYNRSSETLAKETKGLYSKTYYEKLIEIYETAKEDLENARSEAFEWWQTEGCNLPEDEGLEQYDEFDKNIRGIVDKACAEMAAVPHNQFEYAYSLYNKYLGVLGSSKYITDEAERDAESECERAVNDYNNFSDELKTLYFGNYNAMQSFLKGTEFSDYPEANLNGVSYLTDANGIIKVTAYYVDGTEAPVFPELGILKISNVRNGAAKRNANGDIKEKDDSLGVSYFLYVYAMDGNTAIKQLPTEYARLDGNGAVIQNYDGSLRKYGLYYNVEINLEKYYEFTQTQQVEKGNKSYRYGDDGNKLTYWNGENIIDSDTTLIKNSNYDEKQENKLQNIERGLEKITQNADLSLCYLYEYGKEMAMLNASLEGGTLMFTTSKLGMFCVAGLEKENLLLNPIAWVATLALLIVLIIAIKITLKHVRYGVSFVTNGGTPVKKIRAAKGEFFIMPSAPVKDGFVFGGWYSDKDCTSRFIETHMRRRRGYKVYAKWVAPVTSERLAEYYDELKKLMLSYEKTGYKAGLGLSEQKRVACVYGSTNCITLYMAVNAAAVKLEGFNVEVTKLKAYQDVPVKMVISTEETFSGALEVLKRAMIENGMQPKVDYVYDGEPSTVNERAVGFELVIKNDKVASTAEDYFELLRIALKSYVLERDTGKFAPGDKLTLARIYINDGVACLYMPCVKGVKELSSGGLEPRFADTPVLFKVLAPNDLVEAYGIIEKLMTSFGFVKNPENANDLGEKEVPATCGFAYTVSF